MEAGYAVGIALQQGGRRILPRGTNVHGESQVSHHSDFECYRFLAATAPSVEMSVLFVWSIVAVHECFAIMAGVCIGRKMRFQLGYTYDFNLQRYSCQ